MKIKNFEQFNEGYNFDDPEYATEKWPTSKDNDQEVNSDSEFKEYAETVLKNAHGDKFNQSIADQTIEGLLDKYGDDFGAAVGALKAGLA